MAASLHYRPELDGLRAIAVLAVMLFHLDASWLPGGFAGVDVFFVLSGYLVTSIIVRERDAGRFSFARFYQRRIARILPAFLAVALATLTAARFCYSPWDFASTGSAFSAALLSLANFHQLSLGNYFDLSADSQPLLHCWSLSVEEQYYLLFPILLLLILRTGPRLRLWLVAALTLTSFFWCQSLTARQPVHAFYLLPTRAWELLAGSLLATAAPPILTSARYSRHLLRALGTAGLSAVFLTGFLLHEGPHFPGWHALLPVLGTAAFIRYSTAGPAAAFLSVRPLVWIGQLSYSLYLWHWPVFSFIDYSLLYQSSATRLLLKITLTPLLAITCHYLIEKPARTWLNAPRRRWPAFAFLALALASLARLGHALRDRHYLDATNSAAQILTFPAPQPKGTLALLGDSHGTMYGQLARDLAASHHLNLLILSQAGEDPLAPIPGSGPSSALHQHTIEILQREKPNVTILACHWIYKLKDHPERLALTLNALQAHTGHLIVLTQPPLLPPQATRAAIRQGSQPPFFESPADRTLRLQFNQTVLSLASPKVTVLDTNPFFTHPDQSLIIHDLTGRPLFHDPVHLTPAGTALIQPSLKSILTQRFPP